MRTGTRCAASEKPHPVRTSRHRRPPLRGDRRKRTGGGRQCGESCAPAWGRSASGPEAANGSLPSNSKHNTLYRAHRVAVDPVLPFLALLRVVPHPTECRGSPPHTASALLLIPMEPQAAGRLQAATARVARGSLCNRWPGQLRAPRLQPAPLRYLCYRRYPCSKLTSWVPTRKRSSRSSSWSERTLCAAERRSRCDVHTTMKRKNP